MEILFSDPALFRGILLAISVPLLVIAVTALSNKTGGEAPRFKTMSGYEKRRSKRTPMNALFDLDDGHGHLTAGVARLQNISPWGACMTSTLPFDKGQVIRGRIRSSIDQPLQINGRIVWIKRTANVNFYGVAFYEVIRV